MPSSVARWFIEGEIDWTTWNEHMQQAGPVIAGALFGAGWSCWLNATIFQAAVLGVSTPLKFQWPGIVATIALVAINLIPRRDLAESEIWDEGGEFRARLWLFFSFLVALGAVAGSVAVLVATTSEEEGGVGVGSVLQTFFILLSSLILWAYRSGAEGGYGAI